jgi:hypothetical protein
MSEAEALIFDKTFYIEKVYMKENDPTSIVLRAKQIVVDAAATARARLINFNEYLKNAPESDRYRLNKWLGYSAKQCLRAFDENDINKLIIYNEKYEFYKSTIGVIDYTSILEECIKNDGSIPSYKLLIIDEAQDFRFHVFRCAAQKAVTLERAAVLASGETIPAELVAPWLVAQSSGGDASVGAVGGVHARLASRPAEAPIIETFSDAANALIGVPSAAVASGDGTGLPSLVCDGALTLDEIERRSIVATLERNRGHRQKSAKALGIGVRTLGLKLKKWKDESLVPAEL